MSDWYYKVTGNLGEIPNFISYYEAELEQARPELTLKGKTLEKHAAELPGIVEQRFRQLQEIESVLEFLNKKLNKVRADKFRHYLEKYNRNLTSRDAEKYADGDDEVVGIAELVNEVALLRNKYLSINKAQEQRGWMIGHITKLRCAGLDDIKID